MRGGEGMIMRSTKEPEFLTGEEGFESEQQLRDPIPQEIREKIRNDLFSFLEIPMTPERSRRRHFASRQEQRRWKTVEDQHQKRREASIRNEKKVLEGEDTIWEQLDVKGARVLMDYTQHSMDALRSFGEGKGKILESIWYDDHAGRTTSVRIEPSEDRTYLRAGVSSKELVLAANKLPNYDHEAVVAFIRELFGDDRLELAITRYRPTGMTFEGGSPAAFQTVKIAAPMGNRLQSLELVQSLRVLYATAHAVQEQIRDQAQDVTAVSLGQGARNPYEYSDTEFLYEKVHRETVEAIASYLERHPKLVGSVRDVNAELTDQTLTPTITMRRLVPFFNHMIEEEEVIRLRPIRLSPPIDALVLKTLSFKKQEWISPGRTETRTLNIDLPKGYEIHITTPFYAARGEHTFGEPTKTALLEDLQERMSGIFEQQSRERRAGKYVVPDIRKIEDALAQLGFSINDIRKKGPEEQKEMVRKRYYVLAYRLHPDRNLDDEAAATEKMIQLNAAYEVLVKECGLERITMDI